MVSLNDDFRQKDAKDSGEKIKASVNTFLKKYQSDIIFLVQLEGISLQGMTFQKHILEQFRHVIDKDVLLWDVAIIKVISMYLGVFRENLALKMAEGVCSKVETAASSKVCGPFGADFENLLKEMVSYCLLRDGSK